MRRYPLLLVILAATATTACADAERTSWELTERPGDADTTLQLSVLVGGCDEFDHFDVKETEVDIAGQLIDSVTIEAYVDEGAKRDACPDGLFSEERTVELSAPLGDRRLRGCSPPSALYGDMSHLLADDDCASAARFSE
ncbi:MAG: hypothetical protein WD904_10030 [Dehalococcoidia bacterium]